MDKDLLIKLQEEKSYRMLAEADDMVQQCRWDIAANRYYYACYHMLQGLFISRGIPAKTHEGSLTHLGQDFILAGIIDKKFGRFFARMVQLRHKADYNSVAEVTKEEVLEMAPLSKEFIEKLVEIIKE
ncbi:MAG: HEPN domain-containing protein [Prevotella sp.]|nr:HEPN domain-containing protein [Prevotella sp.]